MTARTFHEMNMVVRALDATLSSARYGGGRGGIIPPDDIATVAQAVADASATLSMLANEAPTANATDRVALAWAVAR